MPFYPPHSLPTLPSIQDAITVEQFMLDERYGRQSLTSSKPPFVCGLSGASFDFATVKRRVDYIARALSKQLKFDPNKGSEWDKVVAIFSVNTIDYIPVIWAIHRLGGIATTVNAAYTASQLESQLKDSGAKALFTCEDLLEKAEAACGKMAILERNIFLLPIAGQDGVGKGGPYLTVDDLAFQGTKLPVLPPLRWTAGEGARRIAVLAYSSGTSGLPKGVMLSHTNIIGNLLQCVTFESAAREARATCLRIETYTENCLCVAPMSHIYGITMITMVGTYRGDGVVVLPKYNLDTMLRSVETQKIGLLYLVPPIIVDILHSARPAGAGKVSIGKSIYDLSSVHTIFTAAAPLREETANQLNALFPTWDIRQAYGFTETAAAATLTAQDDIMLGSVGSLLSGNSVRLLDRDGKTQIHARDRPGELCIRGPAVFQGYFRNEAADRETFVEFEDGRYMRSGDEVVIRSSAKGNDHVFITDRIKELIKVKGNQVAPAELEAHLLLHPAVIDCAVIGVPAEREGEVPKAFVVPDRTRLASESNPAGIGAAALIDDIALYVEKHKHRTMWLQGGIEFVDSVPKNPSGKILRRVLRDMEKERRRNGGSRL